jgi:hypothetical protein
MVESSAIKGKNFILHCHYQDYKKRLPSGNWDYSSMIGGQPFQPRSKKDRENFEWHYKHYFLEN